ncbi:RHS repeat domain-containing protein [Streptomyces sp. NPDC054950]
MPAVAGLPAETVANSYNDLGMLTGTDGMTDYVQNIGYSPYGEIEESRLGTSTGAKQLQILNRYEDGTRRLANTHTVAQTNTGYTSDVDYAYDATGNVKSITDKANGKDTQCFAYDGYRRVPEAWTPSSNDCDTTRSAAALGVPAPYWTSWTYKPGGLRDTQVEHKAADNTTTTYGYPVVDANGVGQPHTLTSISVNGGAARTQTYDEQGNTTKRYGTTGTAQSLLWDIEGELTRLTEGTNTTDYLYDANGELLIRRGPGKTVLYLGGQEPHYDTAANKFTAQRYYPAGDATALRTETGLSWMVDGHHGTASMTVDATTQAVTRRYTKPFGEARGTTPSTWPDDKGFLGKPADADTELTHISAREYDPVTGRFLSVDPVLAPEDHESLNGYAYSNNTPVTKFDPSGLRPITACEYGCSDGHGGTYSDHVSNSGKYYSTYTYSQSFQYQKSGGGTGSGTMTFTVSTAGGNSSARVEFKKGPDPAPVKKAGNTNLAGHLAGIGYGLSAVSDLANPFCWFDSGSCSATADTKETYDGWASAAGAATDSSLYESAWSNGALAPVLALGGKFPEGNSEGLPGAAGFSSGADDAVGAAGNLPVLYSPNWALRQRENLHTPSLITPEGRTLSNHAAERVAGSGPGRPPTTLNALDYILKIGNKVKYDAFRDTIQVRATQLPGKPFVAISGGNPNHVVTVMIPKGFDIP